MALEVTAAEAVSVSDLDPNGLESFADTVLATFGMRGMRVSLHLTDDGGITKLNRKHRGWNRPTNVLAFGSAENEEDLGEVVISLDAARREARDAGISIELRIRELLGHGILHLLGYDHEQEPRDRWSEAEARILPIVGACGEAVPGQRRGGGEA